ncbi:MAG: hypothetical protein QG670_1908 [Thermoproteota archaeon]|nr:hypothetical protein [Thermoproteota archaeon]
MQRIIPTTNQETLENMYVIITMEGIKFVENCFTAEQVPTDETRMYQLLLKIIHAKGILPINEVETMGYDRAFLEYALSRGYIEITTRLVKISEEVQSKIAEIIGKAPKTFYA